MIPELERRLTPYRDAVRTAQAALDAANTAPVSPLESLAPAGALIRALSEYADVMADLLSAIGGDEETVTMQVHGRIRALSEQDTK